MNTNEHNISEAKKALKSHIKFLEALLKHLKGTNKPMQARAIWTSWCLHQYINEKLMLDIQKAMIEIKNESN